MEQRLAETDCMVLSHLSENPVHSLQELCTELNLNKTAVTRSISRLYTAKLVVKEQSGKFYWCKINRHKKGEVSEILAIWKICNSTLNNPNFTILRIHNYNIHSRCFMGRYDSSKFKKFYPKNRVCITGNMVLATVSVDLKSETIQIFIKPFYMIISNEVTESQLETEINREITSRYFMIKEDLESKEILLDGIYEVSNGHIAMMDDWLAREAIKHGIKLKDEIDESTGIPEYEAAGADKIKIIWNVIKSRRLKCQSR